MRICNLNLILPSERAHINQLILYFVVHALDTFVKKKNHNKNIVLMSNLVVSNLFLYPKQKYKLITYVILPSQTEKKKKFRAFNEVILLLKFLKNKFE